MDKKTIDELMALLPKHSSIYSLPTVCRAWGKSRNTVLSWIKKGHLRCFAFTNSGKFQITKQALADFLEKKNDKV